MIKKSSIILVLTVISVAACVAKVDCLAQFRISGNIVTENSFLPIESAKVYFIDKGFDNYRSKIDNSKEIGKTDNQGNINSEFEYFWGYDRSWFHREPTMTFEVLVTKKGFKGKRLFYKAKELKRSGDFIQVPLGVIHLEQE